MKRNSLLKFCSLALALVMTLATFGGTFVVTFAESALPTTKWTDAGNYDAELYATLKTYGEAKKANNDRETVSSFTIADAADLAALAKVTKELAYRATADSYGRLGAFHGDVFYITADIDLSGHLWIPIGDDNNRGFGGALIGKKGGVEGAVVTITGFTMNTTTANQALVGSGYNSIENITMVTPYIKTTANTAGFFMGYCRDLNTDLGAPSFKNLTVTDGVIDFGGTQYVGGIVAYDNIYSVVTYTNCDADVTINALGASVKWAGGVSGCSNANNKFVDCDTTFVFNANGPTTQRVGGITGGNANAYTFTNCHAAVDIDLTYTGANAEALVGGIVGFYRNGTAAFENCSATGNITVTGTYQAIGGFAGVSRGGTANYTNCVSTVDIKAPNCNRVGGFVGFSSDDGASVVRTFENCYYGGTITTNTKQAGGFIGEVGAAAGTTVTIQNVTMENCQFDGVVNSTTTQSGAFIGRWNLGTAATTTSLTMNTCVNTGVSYTTYGGARNFAWIGTAANHAATGTITVTNCYSNANVPVIGNNDANADSGFSTVTINGTPVEGDVSGAYTSKVYPALLNGEVTLNENWTVAAGVTPVLKVAANVERPFAAADLSWFDPSKTDFTLTDDADCIGLAQLSWLSGYSKTAYTYIIDPNAMMPATRYLFNGGQTWVSSIAKYIINGMAPGSFATGDVADNLNVYWQVAEGDNQASATTTVRLVSTVDADDIANYAEVGFIIYKGTAAVGYVSSTKIYTAISTGDVTVTAAEIGGDTADYYFTAVLSEVPSADFGTNLTVRAYVITNDGEIIVGEAHTGKLNSLLPAAPVEEETEAA